MNCHHPLPLNIKKVSNRITISPSPPTPPRPERPTTYRDAHSRVAARGQPEPVIVSRRYRRLRKEVKTDRLRPFRREVVPVSQLEPLQVEKKAKTPEGSTDRP